MEHAVAKTMCMVPFVMEEGRTPHILSSHEVSKEAGVK